MRLTTESEYALLLMLALARRPDDAGPISARQLAEDERLPGEFVEQILLRLRRAALVDSSRGAKGGYRLARDSASVTLLDVLSVTEQTPFETACERHPIDEARCGDGSNCSVRPIWSALQHEIHGFLAGITLADLLRSEGEVRFLVTLGRN